MSDGQIEAYEIIRGKGMDVQLSLAVASSTPQMTERFGPVSPQFRERTPWRWSRASHLSSPSTDLTRGLGARRLFRVPPCRELYETHRKFYLSELSASVIRNARSVDGCPWAA
ncbi:hypothetical protein TNCV_3667861 [Trichonephila clavipes]|nr:hypothetical protein TNCV_3667861 [Trichonephila clavipes]